MNISDISQLTHELGIQWSSSNASEAIYVSIHNDDTYRMRIATHSPVYDSSCECYNVAVGECSFKHTDADDCLPDEFSEVEFIELFKRYLTWAAKKELQDHIDQCDDADLADDELERDERQEREADALNPIRLLEKKMNKLCRFDGKFKAEKIAARWGIAL